MIMLVALHPPLGGYVLESFPRLFTPGQAKQQADFVVPGTPLAGRLTGLSVQATTWSTALQMDANHRDRVAYEMAIAINGFSDDTSSDA